MPKMSLKPMLAVTAVSLSLAAPASAQIAKFHMTTPAMPGTVKLDRTSSSEDALADFVGATAGMAEQTSASLGQMRDAESIIAGTGQELDATTGDRDVLNDRLGALFGGNDDIREDTGATPPPARPDLLASVDDNRDAVTVVSRPDAGRQVIIRTRTKGPRGGSKIKSGALWSVGEFR